MAKKEVKRKKSKKDVDIERSKKLKSLSKAWKEAGLSVSELITERYSDIEAERIEWLWENKIPKEGVTIFVGDPETYKSTTSLYVAAQVSQGRRFPGCEKPTEKGSVLIFSSEDSHSIIVKPRLMAADANLKKIEYVVSDRTTSFYEGEKKEKDDYIVDLLAVIDRLEKLIKSTPDFRLLIIDTLTSYFGPRCLNHIEDTKYFIDRLADLSYKYHFAVLIIHHFNKNEEASAQYRSAGSVGIRAAARVQWGFVLDPYDKERAFMLRDKLNISPVRTGLAFHMEDVELNIKGKQEWIGRCLFEDEIIHEDLDMFLNRKQKKGTPKKDKAAIWLEEYLKDGEKHKADDILEAAEQCGIAEKTLRRAAIKIKAKIEPYKSKKTKKVKYWTWQIEN